MAAARAGAGCVPTALAGGAQQQQAALQLEPTHLSPAGTPARLHQGGGSPLSGHRCWSTAQPAATAALGTPGWSCPCCLLQCPAELLVWVLHTLLVRQTGAGTKLLSTGWPAAHPPALPPAPPACCGVPCWVGGDDDVAMWAALEEGRLWFSKVHDTAWKLMQQLSWQCAFLP